MKVLCFHPSIAPYRVDFFNLLARRCDFVMFFLDQSKNYKTYDVEKCKAQIEFKHSFLTAGFNLFGRFIRRGILAAVRSERPSIVISYEYSWVTLLLALYRKLSKVRFVLYTYTDDNPEIIVSYRILRRMLCSFVLRNLDGMIVTGKRTEKTFRDKYHVRRDFQFGCVPIIHDEETFRENAIAVFSRSRELTRQYVDANGLAVFVGRLSLVKGIDWLIEVYARNKHLPLPNLIIVGEGKLGTYLDEVIAREKLESRIFRVGFIHGVELAAYLATARCLVLPSRFEPYGAVVGEALQWGTPCVVSGNVGAQELIEDNVNGTVVPFGDEEAFCKAMMYWSRRAGDSSSILKLALSKFVDTLVAGFEEAISLQIQKGAIK